MPVTGSFLLPWHAAHRAKAHQFQGKQIPFFCCFRTVSCLLEARRRGFQTIPRHHPWFIVAPQAVDTDPQGPATVLGSSVAPPTAAATYGSPSTESLIKPLLSAPPVSLLFSNSPFFALKTRTCNDAIPSATPARPRCRDNALGSLCTKLEFGVARHHRMIGTNTSSPASFRSKRCREAAARLTQNNRCSGRSGLLMGC